MPEIFDGSISENLTMTRNGDAAWLRQALAQVRLLDVVLNLPDSLDARLSAGGIPLSSGQALRLVLARAVISRPRLLLIDETLDHIHDAPDIESLLDVLFDRGAPWTLVIASVHPSLLARCDKIYEIRESGLQCIPGAGGSDLRKTCLTP
jgi:putative ABC transport system ATP-binding protein